MLRFVQKTLLGKHTLWCVPIVYVFIYYTPSDDVPCYIPK